MISGRRGGAPTPRSHAGPSPPPVPVPPYQVTALTRGHVLSPVALAPAPDSCGVTARLAGHLAVPDVAIVGSRATTRAKLAWHERTLSGLSSPTAEASVLGTEQWGFKSLLRHYRTQTRDDDTDPVVRYQTKEEMVSEPYTGWHDGFLTTRVNSPSYPQKFAGSGEGDVGRWTGPVYSPPVVIDPDPTPDPDPEDPDPPAGPTDYVLTGTIYMDEQFATGDFRNMEAIHNKDLNWDDNPNELNQANYPLRVVNAGVGREQVARFEVRNGDIAVNDTNERCEILWPLPTDVSEGDERWYQFDVRIGDPTWPAATSWNLIWQAHHDEGDFSPPLSLEAFPDGTIKLVQDDKSDLTLWTIDPGAWERITMHIKWSQSDVTGFVEIFRNGTSVMTKRFGHNMIDSRNYMKCGIYRDVSHTSTQVVMYDNIRVASNATPPTS